MLPAKALSIEEQINKKEFDGKIGFEQLQSFHGYISNLTTLSDYKHKQYQYVKAMKLKEERRKERLKKEVEKACNPDQLVKFVTNFRIKGIQDNKIEAFNSEAIQVILSTLSPYPIIITIIISLILEFIKKE